jgi:hypothetical protein
MGKIKSSDIACAKFFAPDLIHCGVASICRLPVFTLSDNKVRVSLFA